MYKIECGEYCEISFIISCRITFFSDLHATKKHIIQYACFFDKKPGSALIPQICYILKIFGDQCCLVTHYFDQTTYVCEECISFQDSKLIFMISDCRIYTKGFRRFKKQVKMCTKQYLLTCNSMYILKVYSIQNTLRYNTNVKKNYSDKINSTNHALFFLLRAPTHYSINFNLRFLHELKHKVRLCNTVCEIFHFRFRFVFIKVSVFVQQNAWAL